MISKVSIVTVVMNDLIGLQRTAESIINQKNSNFEWIIVDGGSTDGTLIFANSISKVNKIIYGPDNGIYDAMNKGLGAASSEYIIFMNSGDIFYDDNSIDIIERGAKQHVAVMLFGACIIKNGFGEYFRPARDIASAKYSVPAVQQATVYRKDVLQRIEWPIAYKICGDYAIAVQLLKIGASCIVCPELICKFEIGGLSTKRYFPLAIEAWDIQKKYLKISLMVRSMYFSRRIFAGFFVRWWSFFGDIKNK